MTAIVGLALEAIEIAVLAYLAYQGKKVYQILAGAAESTEDKFSDNGLNNDYIQSVLNILDSKGLNSDITVDNDGRRWISVSTKDGKNALNIVRLDEDHFGRNASWKSTEREVVNIINNEVKSFLEKFESKEENNAKDKKD